MYVCVCVCSIYVCVCVFIHRERERERESITYDVLFNYYLILLPWLTIRKTKIPANYLLLLVPTYPLLWL